jgi:hypothetical protein
MRLVKLFALAACGAVFSASAIAAPVDLSGNRKTTGVHSLAFFGGMHEVDYERVTSSRYVFVGTDPDASSRPLARDLRSPPASRDDLSSPGSAAATPRALLNAAGSHDALATNSPRASGPFQIPSAAAGGAGTGSSSIASGRAVGESFKGETGYGPAPIAALENDRMIGFIQRGEFSSAVEPSPTPLPAAVWLFGTVLFGFGLLSRWRERRHKASAVAA